MNRTSCSLCSWITEQKTYLGLISNSGCRKKLRREKGKYGIKKHDLDLTPSHEHCCGLTEKRSVCSYLWNLLLVKSLIRKAASQVVSAGNELVSSEVLEFVGIVVFFIIQLSTSVALLSPPRLISQVSAQPARFSPGTHFSFSHWTRAIELPLIQNK